MRRFPPSACESPSADVLAQFHGVVRRDRGLVPAVARQMEADAALQHEEALEVLPRQLQYVHAGVQVVYVGELAPGVERVEV